MQWLKEKRKYTTRKTKY